MGGNKVARIEIVAFALGIICVVLALTLVAAFEVYPPMIYDRNNKIVSVENQVENLTDTLYLFNATVWVSGETFSQGAGSYSVIEGSNVSYAGYVFVNVQASTTNATYVRVIYTYYADDEGASGSYHFGYFTYDNQVDVGTNGIAAFPVLPPFGYQEYLEIRIGNTNSPGGPAENETVTITYRY
jgi:hypothetical protein